MEAGLGW